MSTISANQSYQSHAPHRPHSERSRLSSAIDGEVSAGTISQTDATALSSALDSIDSSLSAERGTAASGSTASTTRLDPAQMKGRIDGLIDDQVSGGTLTGDQADTLKSLFAEEGGRDGPGGLGGAGGPPPGPPPGGADGMTADAASDTSDASSASDLLASFIQHLQASQSGGSYAASGTAGSSQASALLFDFKA